jgi:hypothetical protein
MLVLRRFASAVLLAAIAHSAVAVASTALTIGVAGSGSVAQIAFDFFTAAICPGTAWTVTLTPSTPDPDLYATWDTAGFPSEGLDSMSGFAYDGASTLTGTAVDVITIPDSSSLTEVRARQHTLSGWIP